MILSRIYKPWHAAVWLALAGLLALAAVSCAAPPTAREGLRVAAADLTFREPFPQAPDGTRLRTIQDRGYMIFGVGEDVPAFGLVDPTTGSYEGFDIDLARVVAREILGDEDAVEFVPVTTAEFIPFLEEGVVDVIAATITANQERSQLVDFTDAYYVAGQTLLVPADSDIEDVDDLAGRPVGTLAGSTSEINIRARAPDAELALYDLISEAVVAMDAGRLDAVTTDDAILFGFVQHAPGRYKLVGGQFSLEPYSMAVAQGNTALLDAVNSAIRMIKSSREWAVIYERNLGPLGLRPPAPPPRDWRDLARLPPEWIEVYEMRAD